MFSLPSMAVRYWIVRLDLLHNVVCPWESASTRYAGYGNAAVELALAMGTRGVSGPGPHAS